MTWVRGSLIDVKENQITSNYVATGIRHFNPVATYYSVKHRYMQWLLSIDMENICCSACPESQRERERVPSFCLTFRQFYHNTNYATLHCTVHCTVSETCVTVSLLSRPQVAPEWRDQYLTTKLGRVWQEWKVLVEIPISDNSWKRTCVVIMVFISTCLLDY